MSILDWIKILKDLNKEELDSLEMFCQERFVEAWELIFLEWDIANSMYLLKDWKIEVFKKNNTWENTLWYIEAEDVFWEMALFWTKSNRMAWARALEDSTLIIVLDFSIKELLDKHPEIMEKIKELMKKRNDENKKLLD